MSISTEISRISGARDTLRAKAVNLGIAQSTAKIDELATAYDGITNQGAVSATVQEGATYTIPQGYHNGSGTVTGVSGGGNYQLQSKGPITPTQSQQSITPDNGYYGLSSVTIDAIPTIYQDVSSVDATAADVLSGKIIVESDGTVTVGSMTNNGAVSKTLDATLNNQSYTVPSGYHNGNGTVSIVLEQKSATPSGTSQTITATTGKVMSQFTVNAIPVNWGDTTGDDGVAANVLAGVVVHTNVSGVATQITGSMANNGAISATIDGLTVTSYSVSAGYTSGGTVSLTNDIQSALEAI